MVGHVENDDMGMELRVVLAAGIFGETREQQPARRLVDDLAVHPAAQLGMFLGIGKRNPDRPLVRGKDALVARDQRQDRDRLGRADREIPAGMMLDAFLAPATELLAADLAGEQFLELLGVDRPGQAEAGGELAAPFGGFVAALGIIVADCIVAADIGGCPLEAARMDHAGFAFSRGPSERPWLSSRTRIVPRVAPNKGMGVATLFSSSG
jgi:hypothetical protein